MFPINHLKENALMLQWILELLSPLFAWSMTTPVSYGDWATSWFHYVTFALVISLAILLAKFYKNKPAHQVYRFVFVIGIFMMLFESLRQLFFVWQSGGIYPWYVFPFQFCATPIYIGVLIRFVPTKLKESFMLYLGSFSFLAGILVMILPNDIYIDSVYINFQTTYQHGAMIILGLIALMRAKHITIKQFVSPVIIFATFLVIAVVMNTLHNEFINEPTFNMFFINPQYGTSLPILRDIYPFVPYVVFLMIYVFGFSLGAYLLIAINHRVRAWAKLAKKNSLKRALDAIPSSN
jgi:hypothetical protein